jgi:hypothetical protein
LTARSHGTDTHATKVTHGIFLSIIVFIKLGKRRKISAMTGGSAFEATIDKKDVENARHV